jgi:microcystin-dependent protein
MTAHKDMSGADLHEPKGIGEASSGQVYQADGSGSGSWVSLANQRLVGEVVDYAGTAAPSGWLLCYGQAISRTTYSALYAILSTTYGSGDGSTTFNVPDLRGRVSAGQDDMGGTSANRLTGLTNGVNGDTLGATGGLESFTLVEANLPAHTHDQGTLATASSGSHNHDNGADANNGSVNVEAGNQTSVADNGGTANTSSDGAHTHTISGNTGSTGSDTAVGHIQPTIILNKIIYTGV